MQESLLLGRREGRSPFTAPCTGCRDNSYSSSATVGVRGVTKNGAEGL